MWFDLWYEKVILKRVITVFACIGVIAAVMLLVSFIPRPNDDHELPTELIRADLLILANDHTDELKDIYMTAYWNMSTADPSRIYTITGDNDQKRVQVVVWRDGEDMNLVTLYYKWVSSMNHYEYTDSTVSVTAK